MHLCYIEIAREFWKNPYLFSDRATKLEQQKNIRDSETIIGECVIETIRKQLPVRHILKEYFADEEDDEIQETDVQEQSVTAPENPNLSKKYLKKLETVVKKELKNDGDYNISMEDTIRRIIKEELTRTNTPINEAKVDKNLIDTVVEKVKEEKSATPTPTPESTSTSDSTAEYTSTQNSQLPTNSDDTVTANESNSNNSNNSTSSDEVTAVSNNNSNDNNGDNGNSNDNNSNDNNGDNGNSNSNDNNSNDSNSNDNGNNSRNDENENSTKKTNDIVIENIDDIDLELTVDDDNGDKNKQADRETKSPNPLDSLNLDGLEEFDISGTSNNDNGGFSFFKDAKDN
jgi:hypothetical protein